MSLLRPLMPALAWVQRALDATMVVAALHGTLAWLDEEWTAERAIAAAVAALLFVALAESRRLYGSWRLRSLDDELGAVLGAWAIACVLLIVSAFLLHAGSRWPQRAAIAWFLATPAMLVVPRLGARALLQWLRRRGANLRTVAVAGGSRLGQELLRRLDEADGAGVRVAGVFDDRTPERLDGDPEALARRAGSFDELVERCRRGAIDYVFIALPLSGEKRIVALAERLADTTASVYMLPDVFLFDLMRARPLTLAGLPAISVYESPFDGFPGWVKRAEDIVLASMLLVLAAVPMAAIAIALSLSGQGSVFFRQQRHGLNGRIVRVWKFRTMTVSEDGADVVQARRHDPRITPIGRILRATSLDELPQLFNVLRGEMSLVGPRPHALIVNEEYRRLIHGYMLRHKVKPGMTGWAQVNGWHGDDTVEKMKKRIEHDLAYMRNWSLAFDLKILALTALAVFSRRKAW